jgi:hypothetical protein
MTTSDTKIRANRRNAQRSSGPRTAAGKQRSRQNARKHGLSVPLDTDDPEIDELVQVLPEPKCSLGEVRETMRSVAKEQCEVARVQRTRVNIINSQIEKMTDDGDQSVTAEERIARATAAIVPDLEAIDRYERRAQSQLRKTLRKLEGQ